MDYRVQVSAFDPEGQYRPRDPQGVTADTSLRAAEKLCGAGLVKHGPHDRLAATVWETGGGNPHPVRYYRAR
jgi:hypothetical protein